MMYSLNAKRVEKYVFIRKYISLDSLAFNLSGIRSQKMPVIRRPKSSAYHPYPPVKGHLFSAC